ncbi:MAG: hypothetical protein FJ130_03015 [Deltaproteobacteria bacterium]|nr:hypothetical protein [Deltaproteobacteria bacterium]
MKEENIKFSLRTRLGAGFTRIATSFAEESAKAFGMAQPEALKLTLACEEIFMYLSKVGQDRETVEIEMMDGGYYVQSTFLFKTHHFNPRAFNLTAAVNLDDKSSLEEMGLLIASRTVDRFHITEGAQQSVGVVLIKEKSYPELTELGVPEIEPMNTYKVKTSDPNTLKLFIRLLLAYYPGHLYPTGFRFPGKVLDMASSGEYGVQLALDEQGRIGGGLIWRRIGSKAVESFGPYIFNQPPDSKMAQDLTDAIIGKVAKTEAIGLISRYSTPELPRGYFEPLGSIDIFQTDGTVSSLPIYYRQLLEDTGCQVWAHPGLKEFLQAEYSRLFFAREIRLTRYEGEQRSPYSVFVPQFDRSNRQVTLRAIWDGADAADNLSRHVAVLRSENVRNIFFEIDLSASWQANLTETLLGKGFRPRLILPYGGEADVVIFQFEETADSHV